MKPQNYLDGLQKALDILKSYERFNSAEGTKEWFATITLQSLAADILSEMNVYREDNK